MARAYGQRPSQFLGVELSELLELLLDHAAHELGARHLAELRGFPTIDLGGL